MRRGQCLLVIMTYSTFFLKFILHDWPGEDALAIPKRTKAVAKPGSKLVLVEYVRSYLRLPRKRDNVLLGLSRRRSRFKLFRLLNLV